MDLEAMHPHKRSLIVPIDIPLKHLRYLHSAALRARGPDGHCRSGVDFHVRTIGHRAKKKNKVAVDDDVNDVSGVIAVVDDAADEDPDDLLSDGEPVSYTKQGDEIVIHDPATMTMGQLMKDFGESQAAGDHTGAVPALQQDLPPGSIQGYDNHPEGPSWRLWCCKGVAQGASRSFGVFPRH